MAPEKFLQSNLKDTKNDEIEKKSSTLLPSDEWASNQKRVLLEMNIVHDDMSYFEEFSSCQTDFQLITEWFRHNQYIFHSIQAHFTRTHCF